MDIKKRKVVFHLVLIVFLVIFLILSIVYPFLPGEYDSLAIPMSTMIQAGSAVGLLFVPTGILWFLKPQKNYLFATIATIIGIIVAIVVSLVAFATVGFSFALLTVLLSLIVIIGTISRLKSLKGSKSKNFTIVSLYLVSIPIIVATIQIFFAAALTEWSRNQAITNSNEFIEDIETHRKQYGRYPTSLLAQWKDYYPHIVGVEKYHYSPYADSYNLFFEQPRFLFDNLGTREWVVYSPQDEHRMYSHTSWFLLLTPEELERSQGWYAVHDTSIPHWKYFWFD